MSVVAEVADEKTQLFRDLINGKVPKRVPISNSASMEFAIQYAGMDLAETQWDTTKLEVVYNKFCQDFVSDINPVASLRNAVFYQILGSKAIIMGSNGYMQHPEVVGLWPEEYDEFIASPYNCIVETILPRLYTELDAEPGKKAMALAKAMRVYSDEAANLGTIREKMQAKYGFASMGSAMTEAPFDFMADFIRSFKGISGDVRRYPDKVLAACEAVTPLLIKKGTLANPSMLGFTNIPLHMAPYMRDKDFETFYWPTFKRLVEALVDMGQNVSLFVEQDWTRFLDYLYELPENTVMRFEYGDPKVIKGRLGKKHILSGFYPATLLQTGTKQQCIDMAKELIEILAPDGKYWFNTDKVVIATDSNGRIADNLKAVLKYVYENTNY